MSKKLIPDIAYYNAKVYTIREEGEILSAFAVKNGRIVAVGNDDEILSLGAEKKVDLEGRVVLPGFINTHCHMADYAQAEYKLDLEEAYSIPEVVELIKEKIKNTPEGAWINARRLEVLKLEEKRLPNRYELDEASQDIPIFIMDSAKHNFILNSIALKLSGIDGNIKNTKFGPYVELDENGEPTGVLHEWGVLTKVFEVLPPPYGSIDKNEEVIHKTTVSYASNGFTTVHTFGGVNTYGLEKPLVYQKLDAAGKLPIRVILNNTLGINRPEDFVSGFGTDKIKYGAVKFFADGSFAQRTAFLSEDYTDAEGVRGQLSSDKEELLSGIKKAYLSGNDIAVHTIGDQAIDTILDSLSEYRKPDDKQIFRLIHCTFTRPDQWDKIKALNIIIDAQFEFVNFLGTLAITRLGEKRQKTTLAFKSWLDKGIVVTGGDDSPICSNNPFYGIRYATLREGGFGNPTNVPEEIISVYDAVKVYTVYGAAASGEEADKGSIEVGKLADFIVIDRDIFEIDKKEISETKVLASYLSGDKVYEA